MSTPAITWPDPYETTRRIRERVEDPSNDEEQSSRNRNLGRILRKLFALGNDLETLRAWHASGRSVRIDAGQTIHDVLTNGGLLSDDPIARGRREAAIHALTAAGDLAVGRYGGAASHTVSALRTSRRVRRLVELEEPDASLEPSKTLEESPSRSASPPAPHNMQTRNKLYFNKLPRRMMHPVKAEQLSPMTRRVALEQSYRWTMRHDVGQATTALWYIGQINLNNMGSPLSPVDSTDVAGGHLRNFHWVNGAGNQSYQDAALSTAAVASDNKGERAALPKNWYHFANKYHSYRVKGVWVIIAGNVESISHEDSGYFFVQVNDSDQYDSANPAHVNFDLAGPAGNSTANEGQFTNVNYTATQTDIITRLGESPHTDLMYVEANASGGNHSNVTWSKYIPCDQLLYSLGHVESVEAQTHYSVGDPTPVAGNNAAGHQQVTTDPAGPSNVTPTSPVNSDDALFLRFGYVRRSLTRPGAENLIPMTGHCRIVWDISFIDPKYEPITQELVDQTDEAA